MRAVANCVTSHSARLGDQMQSRSPRCRPSSARPAAKPVYLVLELFPGPANALFQEHNRRPLGEARHRAGRSVVDLGRSGARTSLAAAGVASSALTSFLETARV
jgi:hypothetical protein